MNDKSFQGFIFNRLNLFGGLCFGVLIPFITYVKKHNLFQSLAISFIVISVLLLISMYSMYRNIKDNEKIISEKDNEVKESNKKYNQIYRDFSSYKKQYDSNIKELTSHKSVTSTVVALINSEPPKTKEAQKLISILSSSVEFSFKDSDK